MRVKFILRLMIVIVLSGLATVYPTPVAGQNTGGPAPDRILRQGGDMPQPDLCSDENLKDNLQEFSAEMGTYENYAGLDEVYTREVKITNRNGQAFTITVRGPDNEAVDNYVDGSAEKKTEGCFEAMPAPVEPPVPAIPFTDILLQQVDRLGEKAREELVTSLVQASVTGGSAATVLSNFQTAYPTFDLVRFVQVALSAVDTAVQDGTLSQTQADALKAELNLSVVGVYQSQMQEPPENWINIEITLDNPELFEGEAAYVIFFVIDPLIYYGVPHFYGPVSATYVSETVSNTEAQGAVGAILMRWGWWIDVGYSAVYSDTVSGSSEQSSSYSLCVYSITASSYYTLRGTHWNVN